MRSSVCSQVMPSVTTGCVSCVSGDGINGGPVWWTDPYTAWAAKKKLEKKRKKEVPLDDDVEARLKAMRGEGGASEGGGGGGSSVDAVEMDPEVEARLRALQGE
ncbi:MAG: hypothetical protein SGPRY_013615 [Prymnesium sp.]